MDVDSDTLELIERRLSEKVEGQVRERLLKFYRVVWGIATVVLAIFGYNILTSLTRTAETYAESAVAPSVTSANHAAAEASRQVDTIAARLEAIDAYLQRREEKMIENETRIITSQAKVDSASKEMNAHLGQLNAQLGETEAQLNATRERVAEVAGAGNVEDLRASLTVIAEQVSLIAESVRALEAGASTPPPPPDVAQYAPQQIASVVDTLKQQTASAAPAAGTVYFQFAVVDRSVAAAISAALEADNFIMPGAERTKYAEGLHEVRYFFDSDRALAERLTADVNRILGGLGYRADVTARPLTSYKSKPREGTVELWLEPVTSSG